MDNVGGYLVPGMINCKINFRFDSKVKLQNHQCQHTKSIDDASNQQQPYTIKMSFAHTSLILISNGNL